MAWPWWRHPPWKRNELSRIARMRSRGLLKARAYAAVPGQPGVVNALAQLFVALDVAAPFALGALADRFGLALALGALAVQPLGVLAITLIGRQPSDA